MPGRYSLTNLINSYCSRVTTLLDKRHDCGRQLARALPNAYLRVINISLLFANRLFCTKQRVLLRRRNTPIKQRRAAPHYAQQQRHKHVGASAAMAAHFHYPTSICDNAQQATFQAQQPARATGDIDLCKWRPRDDDWRVFLWTYITLNGRSGGHNISYAT